MEQSKITLPAEIPAIPHGTTNEKLIVGKLVETLLANGFLLSVFDGGEETVTDSKEAAAIFAALASTDMDTLYVRQPDSTKRRFVLLVWGNDCDIISDYNTSLEPYIAPASSLSEALQ